MMMMMMMMMMIRELVVVVTVGMNLHYNFFRGTGKFITSTTTAA